MLFVAFAKKGAHGMSFSGTHGGMAVLLVYSSTTTRQEARGRDETSFDKKKEKRKTMGVRWFPSTIARCEGDLGRRRDHAGPQSKTGAEILGALRPEKGMS